MFSYGATSWKVPVDTQIRNAPKDYHNYSIWLESGARKDKNSQAGMPIAQLGMSLGIDERTRITTQVTATCNPADTVDGFRGPNETAHYQYHHGRKCGWRTVINRLLSWRALVTSNVTNPASLGTEVASRQYVCPSTEIAIYQQRAKSNT